MNARYLLRFDDLCPTMNWPIWRKVEQVLLALDVRPIVAIVPDNQDEALKVSEENENFWTEVRNWQARGWTIGLHGYQHLYATESSGLLGINHFSEFSGLSYEEQRWKLERALDIFEREQVVANLWVAPGHSFDQMTLQALRDVGVRTVSDGFYLRPHLDSRGIMWLPQQLWRFRSVPFGLWTICFHINSWTIDDVLQFQEEVADLRDSLTDVASVVCNYRDRKLSGIDFFFSSAWRAVLKGRLWLGNRHSRRRVAPC